MIKLLNLESVKRWVKKKCSVYHGKPQQPKQKQNNKRIETSIKSRLWEATGELKKSEVDQSNKVDQRDLQVSY